MQGSIDFTGLLSGDIIGEGGTTVIANPSGTATDTLNKVQIDETIYSVEGGGGSEVIANPTGTPTEELQTVEIDDVIYSISGEQQQADWTQTDTSAVDYIKHKPTLSTVATSGSYNDLSNTPTIPDSADDISFNNTGTGMVATDVQDAITELKSNLTQLNGLTVYRNLTPQTSYASFNDGSNLPLISLTTSIDPIQDLHGYDHPWAGGAGKNKLNPEVGRASTYYNSQGQALGNPSWSVYLAKVEGLNTVTISGIDKPDSGTYFVWLSGKDVLSDVVGVIGNHKNYTALTVPNDAKYIGMSFINNSSSTSYDLGTAQVESGSTVTAYEPYSNICPISGFTEANVSVSVSGVNIYDGQTYNIQFKDGDNPLTVYGGTLDVVSGLLTVTDGYIASYNGETLPSTWISDRDVYGVGSTPTTGAEVVYELATPQIYQLTPTQVNSLLGQNYIFSDTGNITNVKYIGVLNFS